jgi:signal transduction histidine kinase
VADERAGGGGPAAPDRLPGGARPAHEPLDAWSSALPAASDAGFVLALAAVLFGLSFVVRVLDPNPGSGATVLFVVPIMVLALRFYVLGGLAGAAVSLGLVAVWDVVWNGDVGPLGYATRLLAYAAVGVVAGWFSTRLRAESEARLATERQRDSLAAELLRLEDASRARLAAGLHDDTIQGMAAALLALDALDVESPSAGARGAEARAREALHDTLERTRTYLFGLRPQVLEAVGLSGALQALADRAGSGGATAVRVQSPSGRYPDAIERLVHRVVAEALDHVTASAPSAAVDIAVRERNGWLEGSIRCAGADASGDEPPADDPPRDLALLAERVRLAGGALATHLSAAGAAGVDFRIPLGPAASPGPA